MESTYLPIYLTFPFAIASDPDAAERADDVYEQNEADQQGEDAISFRASIAFPRW